MFNPIDVRVDENIFDTETACTCIVIAHGVNTQGVMGAGFAGLVANQYPQVKAEYQAACRAGNLIPGTTQVVHVTFSTLFIANVASQQKPGRDARAEWLATGLDDMYAAMRERPATTFDLRLPLIGAGIGGLSPTVSVQTITAAARRNAANHIRTTLYLRSTDRVYTEAVSALTI